MTITEGLMLTCVALTEGVETSLGHVSSFDTPDGHVSPEMQDMMDTIADNVKMLEHSEQFTKGPSKVQVYRALMKMAGALKAGEV